MIATPHLLTGAVLGKALRRPWLAWPAALASHFLLDAVPHLDSVGLFPGTPGHVTAPAAGIAAADTVVGIALVLWLTRGDPQRRVMLGAALAGLLPDALFNVPPWGAWLAAWPGTHWLEVLHGLSSQGVAAADWPVGVSTQVTVTALALWGLVAARREGRAGAAPRPKAAEGGTW